MDTAQCYANPGKGVWGRHPVLQEALTKTQGRVGAPRRNWGLLTFVEESCARASLGLAQRQYFRDHLGQTASQLVKGQRGD